MIPQLDGIVYVSKAARDGLLSWLPEAEAVSSAVIPNFVETPKTRADPKSLGDLVSVGGLERVKNQRFLIEVLAEAKKGGRNLTLDLFGDGPCRRDLSRLARTLGVERQVRFQGFRPDVRDLLPGYRAYVHASLKDTGPLAIIEAMAAGLPVIAGQVGGIPELYEAGVEGWFWPLDDPVKAARILIDVLDSEQDRAQSGRSPRPVGTAGTSTPTSWLPGCGHFSRAPERRSRERPGSVRRRRTFRIVLQRRDQLPRRQPTPRAPAALSIASSAVLREQIVRWRPQKLPLECHRDRRGARRIHRADARGGVPMSSASMSQASVSRLITHSRRRSGNNVTDLSQRCHPRIRRVSIGAAPHSRLHGGLD